MMLSTFINIFITSLSSVINSSMIIRYGENLYWGWSSLPGWIPKGTEAVTSWYAEGKTYDYNKEPPIDTPAGHFTQMVWAGSSAMGVCLAAAADRPGKWIILVK